MIWLLRPSREKSGQRQGFRADQAADLLVPVNKRVPEVSGCQDIRETVQPKSGAAQEPIAENRVPSKPVSSPRNPLEPQYLGIELVPESGEAIEYTLLGTLKTKTNTIPHSLLIPLRGTQFGGVPGACAVVLL